MRSIYTPFLARALPFALLALAACTHAPESPTAVASPSTAARSAAPNDTAVLELVARARKLAAEKDVHGALAVFRATWEKGLRQGAVAYDAACVASQAGLSDEAFDWLFRASSIDYHDVASFTVDPDLAALRKDPRWPAVLSRLERESDEALHAEGATDIPLRHELIAMVREDQEARQACIKSNFTDAPAAERMAAVDRKHLPRLKELFDKYGWLGKHRVGMAGSSDTWLLVQHMDADPAFQRRALDLIESAAKAGEASKKHLAYLTDRVLLAEGKPQRYGTQYMTIDGTNVPRTMETPEKVDERRKSAGLGTMAEYALDMQKTYGIPTLAVRPAGIVSPGGAL